MNKEIIKSNLRFWYGASRAVKLWHYHGQTLPFFFLSLKNGSVNMCVFILLLYLGKVLLRNSASPLAAEVEWPGWITDISTLDQHPPDDHRVQRHSAGRRLEPRDAGSLSSDYNINRAEY